MVVAWSPMDKADNGGNIFDFKTGNRGKSNFHHRHVVCARADTVKAQGLSPGETSATTRESERSNNNNAHVFYPAIFLSYGSNAIVEGENTGKITTLLSSLLLRPSIKTKASISIMLSSVLKPWYEGSGHMRCMCI